MKDLVTTIVEFGELACNAFSLKGELISSVPVDPPYEYNVKINEIEFNSIVMVKQHLKLNIPPIGDK
jgi:hypothetical protein